MAFAILLLLPTLTSELPPWFMKVIPADKIHLGLDLQGGMHLLLTVEGEKAVESYLEQIINSLRDELKEKGVPFGKLEKDKAIQIILEFSGAKEKVDNLLSQRFTMLRDFLFGRRGGFGRSSWSSTVRKPNT